MEDRVVRMISPRDFEKAQSLYDRCRIAEWYRQIFTAWTRLPEERGARLTFLYICAHLPGTPWPGIIVLTAAEFKIEQWAPILLHDVARSGAQAVAQNYAQGLETLGFTDERLLQMQQLHDVFAVQAIGQRDLASCTRY